MSTRRTQAYGAAWLVTSLALAPAAASAAPGDLISTVTLGPGGNGACNVAGTLAVTSFGTHYLAIDSDTCSGTTIGIYSPCAGVACIAPQVATKALPVTISGLAWDPTRTTATNVFVWGVHANDVYLIDLGDPTVSGPVVSATFLCTSPAGGIPLTDGLAYDASDDTLYESPDVDQSVYQLSLGTMGHGAACTLLNVISPQDSSGVADGSVSGVAIGAAGTLYIGRNGFAEIRHIQNPSGAFISQFATTAGRVEALTCDPTTYAPLEAILAKDAYNGLYEAFEVEPGTCPLAGACESPEPRTQGFWRRVCRGEHPEQPDRSILTPELCEDLNPNPPSDACERARSQRAALLLNLASHRVEPSCIATVADVTIAELLTTIDALIGVGSHASCVQASSLAASVNEGGVVQP